MGLILRPVGYFVLFSLTLGQYRRNRAVVLGVATVMLFFGFLYYMTLVNDPRIPSWMGATVLGSVVAGGLLVIGFVIGDIFRWAKTESKKIVGPSSVRRDSGDK
jgi:hypothetical protein